MSSGKSFDRFKRDLLLVQIFSWQRHLSITIKVHTALRKPAFLTEQSSFWFALQVFTHRHLISIRRFLQVCLKFPRKRNQTMFFFGSEKKEASPKQTVKVTQPQKRKSTDVLLNQTPNLLSVPKTGRSQSIEKSVHETSERRQISLPETMNDDHLLSFRSRHQFFVGKYSKAIESNSQWRSVNKENLLSVFIGSFSRAGLSRRPERYSPAEVAAFIRGIDSSFESLAERFLQEVCFDQTFRLKKTIRFTLKEIDGKALLLLKTDTLMNHMGLKLGPSLKIVDRIEKLKKSWGQNDLESLLTCRTSLLVEVLLVLCFCSKYFSVILVILHSNENTWYYSYIINSAVAFYILINKVPRDSFLFFYLIDHPIFCSTRILIFCCSFFSESCL